MILLEVEDFPGDHQRWAINLENLEEHTRHHLQEEEDDIFPVADEVLDVEDFAVAGGIPAVLDDCLCFTWCPSNLDP